MWSFRLGSFWRRNSLIRFHVFIGLACAWLIASFTKSHFASLICCPTRSRAALYGFQSSSDLDFRAFRCKKSRCRISEYNHWSTFLNRLWCTFLYWKVFINSVKKWCLIKSHISFTFSKFRIEFSSSLKLSREEMRIHRRSFCLNIKWKHIFYFQYLFYF